MGRIVGVVYDDEKLICPECGKEYKTQQAMQKHIEEKHQEKKDE